MSAPVVQVQYATLQGIAQTFAQLAERTEDIHNQVRRQMSALESGWEGEGSERFFEEMQTKVLPRTKRLQATFTETKQTLHHMMQIFQEAEENAKRLLDGEGGYVPSSPEALLKGLFGKQLSDWVEKEANKIGKGLNRLKNAIGPSTLEAAGNLGKRLFQGAKNLLSKAVKFAPMGFRAIGETVLGMIGNDRSGLAGLAAAAGGAAISIGLAIAAPKIALGLAIAGAGGAAIEIIGGLIGHQGMAEFGKNLGNVANPVWWINRGVDGIQNMANYAQQHGFALSN